MIVLCMTIFDLKTYEDRHMIVFFFFYVMHLLYTCDRNMLYQEFMIVLRVTVFYLKTYEDRHMIVFFCNAFIIYL